MQDFGHLLRVRASGHHACCSICTRHRVIIRKLPHGPAKLSQIAEYKRHLTRQYKDRQVDWGPRSATRIEATSGVPVSQISIICDGMDQAKHCYPRSRVMGSKEFSAAHRPRMGATTIIAHGHAILVGLSPENVPCSGSRTMELLAYMMTKPLNYIHWPGVFVYMQADNCSKELKHQTSLRIFSTMVGLHKLRGCEFNYLQTGHSHEDIDAHFSVTSAWIDRHPELHCIDDLARCLTNMLANKSVRVNEPVREVRVFDQFRDWTHGLLYCILSSPLILCSHHPAPSKKRTRRFPAVGAPCFHPRKMHYSKLVGHLHLKGIGGPGAPHVFRLERLRDSGPS